MLNKKLEKLVLSLSKKNERNRLNLFVAEGPRLVFDLINSGIKPYLIFLTDNIKSQLRKEFSLLDSEPVRVTLKEMKKLSQMKTPQNILAIFHQPQKKLNVINSDSLQLGLDGVQDPGNFGTILRIADWFGIETIICSKDTVDAYNPKVVQSSMGAMARVDVHYVNLEDYCANYLKTGNIIYGAFTEGESIYASDLDKKGLIIMGNEGNGINPKIEKFITKKISIPAFSTGVISESLNVGVATAVICSEFVRRIITF